MNRNVIIKTKKGDCEMEKETFIRWLCLLEIVQKAEEKAEELKIDLDGIDWVKPVAFKKYMQERFRTMEIDLEADEKKGYVKLEYAYDGVNNNHHTQECH
jgi:hypothetical protein